jgi:uncharacterized membrane protein YeaQ/YmgE (transglycosylase-associated protein family)
MNNMQTFMTDPTVGVFEMILIGLVAGWIAGKITAETHGLFAKILIGVAGAFLGGKLAEVMQIPVIGFWRTLIAASVGAIILLWVWRLIHSRRTA